MMRIRRFIDPKALGLLLALAVPCEAQFSAAELESARDAIRELLNPTRSGAFYAATTSLTVNPDLSVANVQLDSLEADGAIDPRLENYRLPLRYTFGADGDDYRPFLQSTLGYQDLSMTLPLTEGTDELVRSDWRSRGIELGAGVEVELDNSWSLLPTVNVGLADLNIVLAAFGTACD